jgi:TonB family protein
MKFADEHQAVSWVRMRHCALVFVGLLALGAASRSACAQTPQPIDQLAGQTAGKAAQTRARRILVSPRSGCTVAPETCAQFESALHERLMAAIRDVQFIPIQAAIKQLTVHGFLEIDAYLGALDAVASDSGAELSISEDLVPRAGGCELDATVIDANEVVLLAELSVQVPCHDRRAQAGMALLRDPYTSVALIPEVVAAAGTESSIRYPSCVRCAPPEYTREAGEKRVRGKVYLVITVNDRGEVETPRVVRNVDKNLAVAAVAAVRTWVMRPATDEEGKPVAARIATDVTFNPQ